MKKIITIILITLLTACTPLSYDEVKAREECYFKGLVLNHWEYNSKGIKLVSSRIELCSDVAVNSLTQPSISHTLSPSNQSLEN